MQQPAYAETTWLEGISTIDKQDTPSGPVLLITLTNNHRYAILLAGSVRQAIYRIASPVAVVSADVFTDNNHDPAG